MGQEDKTSEAGGLHVSQKMMVWKKQKSVHRKLIFINNHLEQFLLATQLAHDNLRNL